MKIVTTRRSDYGIRAVVCLAGTDRELVTAAEIARDMAVPRGFLHQVLQDLQRAGLVRSVSGRRGGYALDRPAEDISILEVLEALEGPLDLGQCALRGGPCRWDDVCALHEIWSAGRAAFCQSLASSTVADVARVDAELKVGRYPIPADSHRTKRQPADPPGRHG